MLKVKQPLLTITLHFMFALAIMNYEMEVGLENIRGKESVGASVMGYHGLIARAGEWCF